MQCCTYHKHHFCWCPRPPESWINATHKLRILSDTPYHTLAFGNSVLFFLLSCRCFNAHNEGSTTQRRRFAWTTVFARTESIKASNVNLIHASFQNLCRFRVLYNAVFCSWRFAHRSLFGMLVHCRTGTWALFSNSSMSHCAPQSTILVTFCVR